ncbi:hypothetical protein PHYSODRAFT_330965 [Phytophthora sojae]|uniref:Uncharacterized protein n=1 Tax=Phytophthora sojae (strain P6497) TaxID=1094619 RepID=G4ZDB4_PHYSP|nr:hypothetical protein PHYSODRAFT_330965 [Phytophthora sojae]EGZ16919.1 hypothetical protein PHYSODRAFT_330965 [Phytophthora sojae]|eukprot:XP_009525977.1 hypothetical protein PHYSODRAFT_330965 [Phytophthora sojae]
MKKHDETKTPQLLVTSLFLPLLSVLARLCGVSWPEEQSHDDASVPFDNDVEDGGYGGTYVALVDDESSLAPTRPTTAAEVLHARPSSPKEPARGSDVDEWTSNACQDYGPEARAKIHFYAGAGHLPQQRQMLRQMPTERRAIHYVITKNTAYLLDESLEAYTLRSRELVAATNANTYGMWPSSALYSGGKFSTYHDPPSGGQASGVVGRTKDLFLPLLSVLARLCGVSWPEEQSHDDASVPFDNDVEDGGYGGTYVALVDDESSLAPTRPTTAAEVLHARPSSPKEPARGSDVDEWTSNACQDYGPEARAKIHFYAGAGHLPQQRQMLRQMPTERRAIHYVITKNTAYLLDESLEAYTLRSRELVAATNANTYGMWPSSALYSGGKFSTYHDPPSGGQASGVVGRTKDLFLPLLSVLARLCGVSWPEEQSHDDASVPFDNDVEDGGYGGTYVALVDDESSLAPTRPTTAAEVLHARPSSPKEPARGSDVDEWTSNACQDYGPEARAKIHFYAGAGHLPQQRQMLRQMPTERRAIHYVITKNTAYLLDESLEAYTLRSRELVAATNANTYGMWPSSALYSGVGTLLFPAQEGGNWSDRH